MALCHSACRRRAPFVFESRAQPGGVECSLLLQGRCVDSSLKRPNAIQHCTDPNTILSVLGESRAETTCTVAPRAGVRPGSRVATSLADKPLTGPGPGSGNNTAFRRAVDHTTWWKWIPQAWLSNGHLQGINRQSGSDLTTMQTQHAWVGRFGLQLPLSYTRQL